MHPSKSARRHELMAAGIPRATASVVLGQPQAGTIDVHFQTGSRPTSVTLPIKVAIGLVMQIGLVMETSGVPELSEAWSEFVAAKATPATKV